jgi:hypothetical protein
MGPKENAKQAMNPKIPNKTKVEFICIDASIIAPSFFAKD